MQWAAWRLEQRAGKARGWRRLLWLLRRMAAMRSSEQERWQRTVLQVQLPELGLLLQSVALLA